MKPIQQYKDPTITNISFDNFTGSIYIVNQTLNEDNHQQQQQQQSMLTSPRTNGADHFVPSHHLALITQPVLGARSRSRKKNQNNIIIQTPTSTKDTIDSMTNSRRSSFNDSPPLILPINRVDTLQYQKKINSNSHHESSDSGLDLSLSTNSSVQLQQYPQQHISIHRPLSALNEDSSPDDGYHDEHQSTTKNLHLKFPPVTLGRNRSMEDMLNNNTHTHDQQHRSSSFSDERQQKYFSSQDQKMQRSSDGLLLDLIDTSNEHNRRINEQIYPFPTQQHRSLNDLTNKNSNKVLSIRNELNINNLPITQTIVRKANTSTLKPLRKKTKLNIIIEPTIPLTSSRTNIYDEQINQMTGTTSSSSNQTTPRSIRPLVQQQIKPKTTTTTPLGYYPNQEQIRAHVNRSVVERQHQTSLQQANSRRGLIQQMIPFDASPSKVNNFLLRHQNHPTTIFHPSSNSQLSPSRQIKPTLPTLYDEQNIPDDKKRFRQKDDLNDIHQKRQTKIKEPVSTTKINHKRENSQEQIDPTNPQRHFINSIQKQQEKAENLSTHTPRRQIEQNINGENRQRRTIINDANRNLSNERYGSSQSTSTTGKPFDGNNNTRRQSRNTGYTLDPAVHVNRVERIDENIHHKQTGNNSKNIIKDKKFSRTNESHNQYGLDYSHNPQKNVHVTVQSRPTKPHLQTNENSTTRNSNRQSNQYQNPKYGNDHHHPWNKSQSKPTRIQPLNINNNSNLQRERETSRLSNISKTDSIQHNKQKITDKNSINIYQIKSPTSWSIISDNQNYQQPLDIYDKTSTRQSDRSTSPSSHDELINEYSSTPSRTYRLMTNDQQQQQPLDGRYVIPYNNLQTQSSHASSSRHTHSFICTPDFEKPNDTLIENSPKSIQNKKQKSITSDVYVLTDRDSTQDTIDHQHSPSPLVHLPSNDKFYPQPSKVTISKEKDEIISNYDSDDGWSDDSAELLYVDERYATEKGKITSSSHLPTQQQYYYQIQQPNVLLQ